MSDSPAAPPSPATAVVKDASLASTPRSSSSPTFLCHDRFLCRDARDAVAQQQQSESPLKLVKPARWFLLRQGCAALGPASDHRQQSLPTFYTQVALWPVQPLRVMFSFSATVCHRLLAQAASANASANADFRRAWRERMQTRVIACSYVGKVQVGL